MSEKVIDRSQFVKECIDAHNECRSSHGVEPLVHDTDLTATAQKWADHLAKSGVGKHSNNKDLGENIAQTSKKDPSGYEICKMWYDEIKDYDFRKPGFGPHTGHFTQVVWKGSSHVGIGVANSSRGTFVVGNYKPAGNISNPGYFERNVQKQTRKPNFPDVEQTSPDDNNSNTTVETITEQIVEDGVRKNKITTVTTTVTRTPEGTRTSTETSIKKVKISDETVSEKLKQLDVHDYDASSSDEDDESFKSKFRRDCLNRHNELRRIHGVPKLAISKTLQRAAQKHANEMLRDGKLRHTKDGKFGENVAMRSPAPTGAEACDMWYDEIKDYDFTKNSNDIAKTGHFTQVVWAASSHIGIGVASKERKTYIAAFYDPPGNFVGQFEANVKKAR